MQTLSPIAAGPAEGRTTIAIRVYKSLRLGIIRTELKPGDSLSEAEVARQLGTSRQPVREAFIKLADIGFVDIVPQRGTFVVKISVRDVTNARFIREAVETAIVGKACALAEPAHIDRLSGLISEQRELASTGDQQAFLDLDDAFHQEIAASADCLFGWRVIEDLKAQMDRVRYLSMPSATPVERLIEQHSEIVAAIARRDAGAASAAMHRHLGEILTSLPKLAAAHPELFVDG